ncbi:hypothetical protein CTA2_12007 [Colletotrichum tanaceti]|nr:hypothetical protein CTA2_12007 [Colletotrichum tanaceti]
MGSYSECWRASSNTRTGNGHCPPLGKPGQRPTIYDRRLRKFVWHHIHSPQDFSARVQRCYLCEDDSIRPCHPHPTACIVCFHQPLRRRPSVPVTRPHLRDGRPHGGTLVTRRSIIPTERAVSLAEGPWPRPLLASCPPSVLVQRRHRSRTTFDGVTLVLTWAISRRVL